MELFADSPESAYFPPDQLDEQGGHFGVTPDSNGEQVYHYHMPAHQVSTIHFAARKGLYHPLLTIAGHCSVCLQSLLTHLQIFFAVLDVETCHLWATAIGRRKLDLAQKLYSEAIAKSHSSYARTFLLSALLQQRCGDIDRGELACTRDSKVLL